MFIIIYSKGATKKMKICKIIKNSTTIKNGIWLYVLQFFNTVFPLITLPYVTRVLGTYNYGIFSYALNIVTYFQVLVEYGFNLSGSRKIAISRSKTEENIYSRIVTSKLLLLFISFIILLIIIVISNFLYEQIVTIFIMFLIVIGTALTQSWVFQGEQRMKYVTISNAMIRLIFMILTFMLVKNGSHKYIYSIIYSSVFIFIGICQILLIRKIFDYKYKVCNLKECLQEIKDGWYVFTTTMMSKILTGIGITILGLKNGDNTLEIGIYSAIQKIPTILNMVYAPIGQALFPYISKKYREDYDFSIKLIKNIIIIIVTMLLISTLIVILFSEKIIGVAFGTEYVKYHYILIPLTIWAFLGMINNVLGIQGLVAQNKTKEYSKAFSISCILTLILNIILVLRFEVWGIALATLGSEFILTLMLILELIKIKNKKISMEKNNGD